MTDVLTATAPVTPSPLEAAQLPAATPETPVEAAEPEVIKGPDLHMPDKPLGENADYHCRVEFSNYDRDMVLDMAQIPNDLRVRLLSNAVKAYVNNRVSTAEAKAKKTNEPWVIYEAAQKNDPMQTIVPVPEKAKETINYETIILGAVKALYDGEFGKRAAKGEKKPKPVKDPLIAHVTRTVVTEVFDRERAKDASYKYFTAQKEVGPDGIAYMRAEIAKLVAQGRDEKELNKYLEDRYITPAKIQLGLALPKSLKDAAGIL